MNAADSLEASAHLTRMGAESAPRPQEADWILINTCTVRQAAEDKAISYIGRWRRWREKEASRRLLVLGCAGERLGEEIKTRFPFVDDVIGAKSMGRLGGRLEDLLQKRREIEVAPRSTIPTSTFVTAIRGCSLNCTFCIVPFVRGPNDSRNPEEIMADVRAAAVSGAKEVTLLGQTVNAYRADGMDLAGLLKAASKVGGILRLRFMTSHPIFFSERLIEALSEGGKICEHVHLPVQSGSDPILSRMKRRYTRKMYAALAEKIRKRIPGVSLTTDFIVGFPGESETDFQETLSLVDEVGFESAYTFKFSPREATAAFSYPEVPSAEVQRERLERLNEAVAASALRRKETLVGSLQEVLVEDKDERGRSFGKTRSAHRVVIVGSPMTPGVLVRVRIENATAFSITGALA